MRFDLFYIIAFACVVAIVGFALEPGLTRRAAERASLDEFARSGVEVGVDTIAQALLSPGMRLQPFELDGDRGVQLRAQAPLVGDGGGVAVYVGFPAGLTERWRGQDVEITLEARSADPLPYETWAARLVLVDSAASPWQRFDGAPDWEARRFRWRIPEDAPNAPLQLAIYPSVSGSGKGIDVRLATARPVPNGG